MKKIKPAYLLALILLNFSANSHSADTYDLSNKTLTIPLVTVGNTTFGTVDGGFLMQFESAVKQGNQVTIKFTMTSQFKDTTTEVGQSFRLLAALTDDKGNAYEPSSIEVANKKNAREVTHKFPADTEIPVTYIYDNIATNATSISLLDLNLY